MADLPHLLITKHQPVDQTTFIHIYVKSSKTSYTNTLFGLLEKCPCHPRKSIHVFFFQRIHQKPRFIINSSQVQANISVPWSIWEGFVKDSADKNERLALFS